MSSVRWNAEMGHNYRRQPRHALRITNDGCRKHEESA